MKNKPKVLGVVLVLTLIFVTACSPPLSSTGNGERNGEVVVPADPKEYIGDQCWVTVPTMLEQAKFHRYDPPFKAKRILKSKEQATCRTPEELMISLQSATNQDWEDQNWHDFERELLPGTIHSRLTQDIDDFYFELVHKLTFVHNGVETAIIKFWVRDMDDEDYEAFRVMQKIDGRWYAVVPAEYNSLQTLVMYLSPNAFEVLLTGKNIQSQFMQEIVDKTRLPGGEGLDFGALDDITDTLDVEDEKLWLELYETL